MRPKKAQHSNHERWLISYADFITLLFAFFVVMFATSQADKKKQAQAATAIKSAFKDMSVFESKPAPMTPTTPMLMVKAPANMPKLAVAPEALAKQLKQHIDSVLAEQIALGHISKDVVSTHIGNDGLVISLHDAGFFPSGSAEVNPQSIPMLKVLVDQLPELPIRVEGHTDNVLIRTELYATNWELSTARASAIARFVIGRGHIDPRMMSAAGYAEFHPVASNDTPEGRTQNRRVDIILLTGQVP